jgi:hypothetical protein
MRIYQKRTPTFLAEITGLITTLLLIIQEPAKHCGMQIFIYYFYWGVLCLAIIEITLKLVIFSILYWKNREIANTFNTIVLILVAIAHLGVWIYSISLYSNQELAVCHPRDRFFVKVYFYVYGTMIVGGAFLFIVLGLSALGVTMATLKAKK